MRRIRAGRAPVRRGRGARTCSPHLEERRQRRDRSARPAHALQLVAAPPGEARVADVEPHALHLQIDRLEHALHDHVVREVGQQKDEEQDERVQPVEHRARGRRGPPTSRAAGGNDGRRRAGNRIRCDPARAACRPPSPAPARAALPASSAFSIDTVAVTSNVLRLARPLLHLQAGQAQRLRAPSRCGTSGPSSCCSDTPFSLSSTDSSR